MLKSAIDGIKLITNSERLVYVLWFASGLPGMSGRRCLSISRVAYTWKPTVSRGSTLFHLFLNNTFKGYFMNYNSFKKLERMDSAVPQQSARVC